MREPYSALPTALRAHLRELPMVRRGILDAVRAFSEQLPPGARVLDAGAGNAPYADLFAHCDYVTADWGNSVHEGASHVDVTASLDSLPLSDEAFDAVLCTEVLEHVERPQTVIRELHRVLVRSGVICITVPFVWPLHEEPYDYFRYTPHALRGLLENGGFADVSIAPTSGYFTTLAQVSEMTLWLKERPSYGSDRIRLMAIRSLWRAWIRPVSWLARRNRVLDQAFYGVPLPLGYRATAVKPG